MASQRLEAWIVDATAFSGVLGSKNHDLVAKLCACRVADDVREDVEHGGKRTLEDVVTALIDDTSNAPTWTNRRAMKLVADTFGARVDTGIELPGRGWQFLAPAWAVWKSPAIAKLWATAPEWANHVRITGEWPHIMWAAPETHAAILAEIAALHGDTVEHNAVPSDVPRFGDPEEWPPDELAVEIMQLSRELEQIVKAAHRDKRALIVWLDGGQ